MSGLSTFILLLRPTGTGTGYREKKDPADATALVPFGSHDVKVSEFDDEPDFTLAPALVLAPVTMTDPEPTQPDSDSNSP